MRMTGFWCSHSCSQDVEAARQGSLVCSGERF
jgi:hypothetical protein